MFDNKRYLSKGVHHEISTDIQTLLWIMIDRLEIEKDYLQIFVLSENNGNQHIIHKQEVPEYTDSISFKTDKIINEKVYCIDDGIQSIMILASEY